MDDQQSNPHSIYVVIAAWNEAETIASVVRDVLTITPYVVVVDDGSKDATALRAREAGAIVLQHPINLGQGAGLQTGIRYALRFNPDAIVTFDGDGQMDHREIPLILAPVLSGEVDVTLGSRFLGKAINMPTLRKHTLKLGIIFTWFVSGIKLTDAHNGFRGLSQKAAKAITITQNGMAHASEIIDEISNHKLSYKEIPVTVSYTDETLLRGQKTSNALRIGTRMLLSKLFS